MARLFTKTSSNYIKNDVQLTSSTTNISFGCWFKTPATLASNFLMYNGHTGSFGQGYGMQTGNTGTNLRLDISFVGSLTNTTVTLTTDTWYHGVITRGASTWNVYINGGAGTTSTSNPFGFDSSSGFVIGGAYNTGATNNVSNHWNGDIAESFFFERELSAAEVAILAKGYSPLFLGSGLTFYAPLVRDIYDIKAAFSLTDSGTAASSHPRIIYPSIPQIRFPGAAAAAAASANFFTLLGAGT